MNKNLPYKELATLIAKRSICQVKVGAIIYDSHGIISWGWNHSGFTGNGNHAETEAIRKGNRARYRGATILTIAIRRGKFICSFPCPKCFANIKNAKIRFVECFDQNKNWSRYII